MYFIIDNYDSFVYNLSAYLNELGHEVIVKRADDISISEIESLHPQGIIISPGPGKPADATASIAVLEHFKEHTPILGVCLGHQLIAHFFGATVKKGPSPMHGKISTLCHDHSSLYHDLPEEFPVTRYHSLVVSEENLPSCLSVNAKSTDGIVMGISHKTLPIYGVQYHPEAVLTKYGHELLENFHKICQNYQKSQEVSICI